MKKLDALCLFNIAENIKDGIDDEKTVIKRLYTYKNIGLCNGLTGDDITRIFKSRDHFTKTEVFTLLLRELKPIRKAH